MHARWQRDRQECLSYSVPPSRQTISTYAHSRAALWRFTMKSVSSRRLISLFTLLIMLSLPMLIAAQTRTRPRIRRSVRRTAPVVPIVPIGTNLKIRIEDTLSSKDSRVGDRFTATALDPVRFNEGRITGHISSIQKSGKIKGRTSMNLAFDTITLGERTGTMHGYVTRVYGSDSGRCIHSRLPAATRSAAVWFDAFAGYHHARSAFGLHL